MQQRDILMKALLDEQEKVRDFEVQSKKIEDPQIQQVFKQIAKDHGYHAKRLQELLGRFQ
ncbi:ferritin family protein [Garciella nitratireducens]|uniref:Rubrerythrin n=1 Tax=Garciella nitratireducens DSM 15102 TaxID=1121911 RepID=A0A1T4LG78_9FIRM|nr:ferritin family protein [Garciella nitratireducens]SJZ53752.1 Rubrerythrin [Garciella nitratireducens DSM 15102]